MSDIPAPNPEHVSAAHLAIQGEMSEMEMQLGKLLAQVGLGTLSTAGASSRVMGMLWRAYALGSKSEWTRAHEMRPPITDSDGRGPFSNSGP